MTEGSMIRSLRTPEEIEAERRSYARITLGVRTADVDSIPDDGTRYTRDDWSGEEFRQACLNPTPALRLKWFFTDWLGGPMPLIVSTPEEWDRLESGEWFREQMRLADKLGLISDSERERLRSTGKL